MKDKINKDVMMPIKEDEYPEFTVSDRHGNERLKQHANGDITIDDPNKPGDKVTITPPEHPHFRCGTYYQRPGYIRPVITVAQPKHRALIIDGDKLTLETDATPDELRFASHAKDHPAIIHNTDGSFTFPGDVTFWPDGTVRTVKGKLMTQREYERRLNSPL